MIIKPGHKFAVHLIDPNDWRTKRGAKEPLAVLYEGDSYTEAQAAAQAAATDENRGKTIRFCDFHLFGGGIKDTPILG